MLKTQAENQAAIRRIWAEMGGDSEDLDIRSPDAGITFEVRVRGRERLVILLRHELDDKRTHQTERRLRNLLPLEPS